MQPRTGAVPPHRPPEHGRWGTAAVLRAGAACAAAVLLAAGCSTGSDSPPGAGGSSSAGAAGASAAGGKGGKSDKQAALAAYTAMWEEAAAASHKGGGATGQLDRYATGAALLLLSQALAGAEGTQVTGEPVLDPEVEIEGADRAHVTDCLDDSGWNLGTAAASASGPRRVEAGLVHDGLAWRVSELRIWEPGTC